MSKALATVATQPLIVAKVGLQSRPPPARQGKPFKSFPEVLNYIIEHEGLLALFKGIMPQIAKGVLVQGLLMMTKERYGASSADSTMKTNIFQNGAIVCLAVRLPKKSPVSEAPEHGQRSYFPSHAGRPTG